MVRVNGHRPAGGVGGSRCRSESDTQTVRGKVHTFDRLVLVLEQVGR